MSDGKTDTGAGPLTGRRMETLLPWGAALLLCLAQWRHMLFYFSGTGVARWVDAANGVLIGLPHWRVYQSRLLGPALVKLVSFTGLSFFNAYFLVTIVLLTCCSVLAFETGRKLGGTRTGGWAAMLTLHALFLLTQAPPWLYIWDFLILLTGFALLRLMIAGAPWWAYLILMAIAFLNHESGFFIGVWMGVQGLADNLANHRLDWRRWRWGLMAAGGLGGIAGLEITEVIRSALLVREIGPEIFQDTSNTGAQIHLKLFQNLSLLGQWFTSFDYSFQVLVPLMLLACAGIAVALVVRHGYRAAGLAAYVLVQVVALVIAAELRETRVLLQLVPFLCLGGRMLTQHIWPKEAA
ncbi:MAG: hypothetical protein PW843_07355 [Azospirillaceae bacterium]|nr:hypothetical protein [Azospirillaceae bacterium]